MQAAKGIDPQVLTELTAGSGRRAGVSHRALRLTGSSRLTMRPRDATETDFLFDLDLRHETVRYLRPQPEAMIEKSEAVEFIQRRRFLGDLIRRIRVIISRDTGEPLGSLLLKPAPHADGISGGRTDRDRMAIRPDAQGAGYTTEAAGAVISDARVNGLSVVIAVTDPPSSQ